MNIDDVALAVIDALATEQVPYMLVGSFSTNYYGIPRSTADADIVVHLTGKSISCLLPHLPEDFHLEPQTAFETVRGTTKHLFHVRGHEFKVEVFRLSEDPHDQERFRHRRAVPLFQREVFLPSPEDVIITKLRWFRRKDRDDIENVVSVQQAKLDWPYIYSWCDQHGTRELLDGIRASIPPI